MVENSDVVQKILMTLINISSRKTTEGHAVFIMDSLIKKLMGRFEFLKYIEINDTRFLEDDTPITVMGDIDYVSPINIGKAIYAIIFTMNDSLGKDAGHFFMKEISKSIGDEYRLTIMDMGVDLSLMQLEYEVKELEKRILNTHKTE